MGVLKAVKQQEIQDLQVKVGNQTYKGYYDGHTIKIVPQEPPKQKVPMPKPIWERIQKEADKPKPTPQDTLAKDKLEDKDKVFHRRLGSIMFDNKYDRIQRNRTRGNLDLRHLYKVRTGSNSVFQQKKSRANKEYNIVLLVDASGSMHSMMKETSKIVQFLAQSFEGININLAVATFNHMFLVHKEFDEQIKDYEKFRESIYQEVNAYAGCNHDFQAMQLAYKMFAGRKGKNILVMLSDGQPAVCGEGRKFIEKKYTQLSNTQYNRKQFEGLVKANKQLADSVAIGIRTESWQIPDNITVNNLSEAKVAILNLLKRKIKRG